MKRCVDYFRPTVVSSSNVAQPPSRNLECRRWLPECGLLPIAKVVLTDFHLFAERVCNKSRSNQSKDQRIQHDEVGRLRFQPRLLLFQPLNCFYLKFSAPSSRSEPSPKAARQSLSIKQAFLGGKSEGRIHSPHSPRPGEERRPLKGKTLPNVVGPLFSPHTGHLRAFHLPDEASPPRDRAAWKLGIAGIMRRPFEKKTPAGVMFGVRLDECPPAQTNRVGVSRKAAVTVSC